MIKRIFLLSLFISIAFQGFSQKILVWCPPEVEIASANDKLKGLPINLVISDARKITDSIHVECSSMDLITNIQQSIVRAYPAAVIQVLDTNQISAPSIDKKITIRIFVSAYHSASGTTVSDAIGNPGGDFNWGGLPKNKWNSVAGFHVIIEDKRTETSKLLTRNIANIVSRPNIGGSLTAKKALFEAYKEANRELLYFIENTLR